jgi:uncharacterized protein YlxW (UPF0749 family)
MADGRETQGTGVGGVGDGGAGGAGGAAVTRIGAWRRLGRAMTPRRSRAQLAAALICALLGFGAVTQVRHTAEADYSQLREAELVQLLDRLTQQQDLLERQNADLEAQRADLEDSRSRTAAALEAAKTQSQVQGVLAGTAPAEGTGIALTVYDPDGTVGAASV